eukprot:5369458-Amphidinium_carterae.1
MFTSILHWNHVGGSMPLLKVVSASVPDFDAAHYSSAGATLWQQALASDNQSQGRVDASAAAHGELIKALSCHLSRSPFQLQASLVSGMP